MNITERITNEIRITKKRITKQKCVESDSEITIDDTFDLMFLHRLKNVLHTANNKNASINDIISDVDKLIDKQFNER